jgi:multiple sugar transport system permease protein
LAVETTLTRHPASRSAGQKAWDHIEPYLYLSPALIVVGVFLLYPVVYTLYISLTKWDGLTPPVFIGLQNYIQVFRASIFRTSFLNSVLWVVATLALPVALGLLLALLINRIPFQGFFKAIFYLPYAISATSVAVLWSFLLSPVGIINEGLRTIGLEALAKSWLITPPWHNIAMIIAYTWLSTGTNMILFLVGLQSIPTEPVEAAKIDGANGWQAFWKVIFPLLRPITTVVVTIAVVNGFKVFDLIWVMTQGGPYRSSETLALTMYREAFVSFRLGYGAAIAVILSLIVVFFSIFYLRSIFRRED